MLGQGPKYNGKSLFSNYIAELIPMYCATMAQGVVIDMKQGSAESHSSHITHLNGMRLAILNETGQSDRLNEDQVKSITGGGSEKKNVRAAHSPKAFDMDLRFVPFIFTNFPPSMSLNDGALWKRLCPVLFPVTFKEDPDPAKYPDEMAINEDLNRILRQEKNKVQMFNWLVRCCVYYCQNQNKEYPERINNILKDYMKSCNELFQFLDENSHRYKFDDSKCSTHEFLRNEFEEFCNKRFTRSIKQKVLDHKYFELMLNKLNLTIFERDGKKYINGLVCNDFTEMNIQEDED